jgi:hypothetical protein
MASSWTPESIKLLLEPLFPEDLSGLKEATHPVSVVDASKDK